MQSDDRCPGHRQLHNGSIRKVHSVATVLAGMLALLGVLSCAFGALIFASIPRSDTATGSLVVFALEFVIPGLAAIGTGAWVLRLGRRARRSTTP